MSLEEVKESKIKFSYFRDLRSEFKKISWTSRSELISNTKVVISSIFLFGLAIYVADIFIRFLLGLISSFSKFIIG